MLKSNNLALTVPSIKDFNDSLIEAHSRDLIAMKKLLIYEHRGLYTFDTTFEKLINLNYESRS